MTDTSQGTSPESEATTTITDPDNNPDQGTNPEPQTWLPLKEAAAMARRCDATIKRAIKAGKLTGRRLGKSPTASYEVLEHSLTDWLASIGSRPAAAATDAAAQTDTSGTNSGPDQTRHDPAAKPLPTDPSKAMRGKKRRSKEPKAAMPKEAKLLRRWKNNLRSASQEQTCAMIQWLARRLKTHHGMSRKQAKAAVRQARRQEDGAAPLTSASNI